MKKFKPFILGLFLVLSWSGVLFAEEIPSQPVYEAKEITTPQVSGKLYVPKTITQTRTILVLGGSSGRLNQVYPERLAEAGFVVLSLAFFNAEGLPETLDRIPLETVSRALDWLQQNNEVKNTAFGVLGVSRGSELALLAASFDQRISAVVAVVPSSVAWHGQTGSVAWTQGGNDVSALSFVRPSEVPLIRRVEQALSETKQRKSATIPVEQINGRILLISAQHDHIWPSKQMAEYMVNRLKTHSFTHPYQHIIVEDNHFLDEASIQAILPDMITTLSVSDGQ
jgi:dienelactone hydrolase